MIALGVVLAVLVAVNLIRIGVQLEYSVEGIALDLRICCWNLHILPPREKTEAELLKAEKKKAKAAARKEEKARQKKEKEEKRAAEAAAMRAEREAAGERQPEEPPVKKGGKLDLILSAVPPAFDAIGTFLRHLRFSKLKIYFTSAGDDPFNTVMTYGRVSAVMGVLTPILESMKIRDRDLRSFVDLEQKEPAVYVFLRVGMALWEYVYIVLRLGCKFLVRYLRRKKRSREKAAERA